MIIQSILKYYNAIYKEFWQEDILTRRYSDKKIFWQEDILTRKDCSCRKNRKSKKVGIMNHDSYAYRHLSDTMSHLMILSGDWWIWTWKGMEGIFKKLEKHSKKNQKPVRLSKKYKLQSNMWIWFIVFANGCMLVLLKVMSWLPKKE